MRKLGWFLTLFVVCPAMAYRLPAMPTQHIIMVDANGRLMDPTGAVECHPQDRVANNEEFTNNPDNKDIVKPPRDYTWSPCNGSFNGLSMRALNERDRNGYLADMLREMDAFFDHRSDPSQPREVVLFIHGGLDTNHDNLVRAQALSQRILNEGKYPIFVIWQSNLWRSLGAHLFTVRQGDYVGPKSAPLFPFFLAADLGRAVMRAPIVWWYMVENDVDRVRRVWLNRRTRADDAYCNLRQAHIDCPPGEPCIDISKGPFAQTLTEGARSTGRYTSTGLVPVRTWAHLFHDVGHAVPTRLGWWSYLPVRYLLAPIVDGLGTPAWKEMERHAVLGFHGPGEGTSYDAHGDGGIASFLTQLKAHIDATTGLPSDPPWQITLIGHSMGTIIANHILRDYPELPVENIVYMAAACSVRDYEDSVLPFLKIHEHDKHPPQMYHLMLHDFAEIRDQYGVLLHFIELPPSGSLLVWIDNYFTDPATLRDRTAGRFDNLLLFLDDTPTSVRRQTHVKIFGVGEEIATKDPQHHGSFTDFDGDQHQGVVYDKLFWDSAFWQTEKEDRRTSRPPCLLREH